MLLVREITAILLYITNNKIMEDLQNLKKLMSNGLDNQEERLTKIEKSIDILKYTLREVLLKIEDKNTNTDSNTKIPKDRVLIQSLLERAKDEFHIKFLSNILANSYDTLTPKQNSVLTNIQNSL